MNSTLIQYRSGAYADLEREVLAALDDGADGVVLDLDGLERLDSAEVRELILLLRRARSQGGEMLLRASKPLVLRTLSTTGLDRVFSLGRKRAE